MGWERRFRMPDDVNVTTIHTNSDLGFVLNFDAEQSRRDMAIGYLDAQRVLYGLYGQKYYIDRTMTDREALEWLLDHCAEEGENLRAVCERSCRALPASSMQRTGIITSSWPQSLSRSAQTGI